MSSYLTPAVHALIDLALEEDLGRGDVTSDSVLHGDGADVSAVIVAKQDLVVFGMEVATQVFLQVDGSIILDVRFADGSLAKPGDCVAMVRGPGASVLRAERTALNFLQRLSGVATLSRRYAEAVAGTSVRVCDTRKTTPGFRLLERRAVRAGGCHNHRPDLGSGILIKDNHIVAAGGIESAVAAARKNAPHSFRVEVEVSNHDELEQALAAGADVVLLDNMSPAEAKKAARAVREAGSVLIEVSGGVTLDTVRSFAEAGVDVISVGALTHSAPAVDLSLDFLATP